MNLDVDQFQLAFVHAIGNAQKNFDTIVPRVSKASPYIKKALQIGIDAGITVMAEGLTPCTLIGYEEYLSENFIPVTEIKDADMTVPDFKKVRITEGKRKFTQCLKCKYDNICEGPWKEYPDMFGSGEFKPIE